MGRRLSHAHVNFSANERKQNCFLGRKPVQDTGLKATQGRAQRLFKLVCDYPHAAIFPPAHARATSRPFSGRLQID